MEYMSTPEASRIWGITANRISILARQGRIPGAVCVGSRWMIPKNAPKPHDGRIKNIPENDNDIDTFRYPYYVDKEIDEFVPPLSEDEKKLRNVQCLFVECKFEEAVKMLESLPDTAKNIYVKIGALYYACLLCVYSEQNTKLHYYLRNLYHLLDSDFPYKEEMEIFPYELNSHIGANHFVYEDDLINPLYKYHESVLPVLIRSMLYCHGMKRLSSPKNIDASLFEVNLSMLEKMKDYSNTQSIHIYLCTIYILKRKSVLAQMHLKKAFEIAAARKLYYHPAFYYTYAASTCDKVLQDFPIEFADKIKSLGAEIKFKFVKFMKANKVKHIHMYLARKDYYFITYVLQNKTNKEIAADLNISESAVAKKYSEIYNKLNINSKEELRQMFISSNNQNFF